MKIKENLSLRRVGRNYMVVQIAEDNTNLTNVYTMNETAAWLWKECGTLDFTQESLVKRLCEEYEVSQDVASKDVDSLVKEWLAYGLVE